MNPSRVTMLENSDFIFRFFQTSATEQWPSAAAFTCKSTQPALKLAERKILSPPSTTGWAHLGHLSVPQAYSQRSCPSFGECPVTLAALIDRICRQPARVTRAGELKLALWLPACHTREPSLRRKASNVERFVMPPVTTTRSSTTSGDELLPK